MSSQKSFISQSTKSFRTFTSGINQVVNIKTEDGKDECNLFI
jgi:hypothetical protein